LQLFLSIIKCIPMSQKKFYKTFLKMWRINIKIRFAQHLRENTIKQLFNSFRVIWLSPQNLFITFSLNTVFTHHSTMVLFIRVIYLRYFIKKNSIRNMVLFHILYNYWEDWLCICVCKVYLPRLKMSYICIL